MSFQPVVLEQCFPELWGFALLDPARLDEFYDGTSRGLNVLDRLTGTDEGDAVAEKGIAVPVIRVEAGYYNIEIRDREASDEAPSDVASRGWILGTDTGELVLCGVGFLAKWDPDDARHRRITVPPGWYEVDVLGYLRPDGAADGTITFLLSRSETQPALRARPDQPFQHQEDD